MAASSVLVLLVVFSLFVGDTGAAIVCRDDNNNPVDWFVMYKLPKHYKDVVMSAPVPPSIRAGLGYAYLDSNYPQWTISSTWLNSSTHALAYTLNPVYKAVQENPQEIAYVFYNDEKPNEKSYRSTDGHTKGVVAFDAQKGFWLVHSLPKFPRSAHTYSSYEYAFNGIIYGQAFLCVTMATAENIDKIGKQLFFNQPWINDYTKDSNAITQLSPEYLDKLIQTHGRHHVKSPPWNNTVLFNSKGGQTFKSFAKASQFHKELYEDWLAPSLGQSLNVESWMNGDHNISLPSNCSGQFKVFDCKTIRVRDGDKMITFPITSDHAKWAVSRDGAEPWVCIGDINRQITQEKRGGGTVCTKHPQLWKAFNSSVLAFYHCGKGPQGDSVQRSANSVQRSANSVQRSANRFVQVLQQSGKDHDRL